MTLAVWAFLIILTLAAVAGVWVNNDRSGR